MAKNTNTTTARRTLTNTSADGGMGAYKDLLASWPTKYAGPKPTAANFAAAHSLGPKPGTKTAVALAMYFRDGGADQGQVVVINKGPYLNAARAAVAAGQAIAVAMPANDGHKVYKLALPTKKVSKPKAKASKPRKAASKPEANATT